MQETFVFFIASMGLAGKEAAGTTAE